MTNIQINQILQNNSQFRGCYCKDQLNWNCRNGYYIVNLDDSTNEGTHWVAFYKANKLFIYFDSVGVVPPKEVIRCANTLSEIYYNEKQIQDYNASSCGFYCIAFVKFCNSRDTFNNFIKRFSYFTQINDHRLLELLNK